MKVITVINAKGGCGKSTIAVSVAAGLAHQGYRTLLIDMDPQAQVTEWLRLGDGLSVEGTLTAALAGNQPLHKIIQSTEIAEGQLHFVPSSEPLEHLGRQITQRDGYEMTLARQLSADEMPSYEFVVLDSPNQISPVMENAIFTTDLFVIPFMDTKSVKSYANVYALIQRLRPDFDYRTLHVLNNVSRLAGLYKRINLIMDRDGIERARSEIRSCGWLSQVDEHGGSIFDWRPSSNGAQDITSLVNEIREVLMPALTTLNPQNRHEH